MNLIMSITIGMLFTAGIYMILRRSFVKVIIGLMLLSHAANLLIFTIGRLTRGNPAIIPDNAKKITGDFAEPLPQALILTAIVIGFGVQAFAIVLFKRVYQTAKTDDLNKLNNTDRI